MNYDAFYRSVAMGGNRDGCINTKDNGIEHFCMEFKGYEIL